MSTETPRRINLIADAMGNFVHRRWGDPTAFNLEQLAAQEEAAALLTPPNRPYIGATVRLAIAGLAVSALLLGGWCGLGQPSYDDAVEMLTGTVTPIPTSLPFIP